LDYTNYLQVGSELVAIEPQFRTGKDFLQTAKMLLNKLSNSDWTPLDRDQIRSRTALLQANLAVACHFGNLTGRIGAGCAAETVKGLTKLDTQVRRGDYHSIHHRLLLAKPNVIVESQIGNDDMLSCFMTPISSLLESEKALLSQCRLTH